MNSTAVPDALSARTTSNSRSTSAAESAAVGSSITMTRASSEIALPISTTCWSAMDSPRAIRAGSSWTPSRAKIAAASVAHGPPVDPPPGPERLAPDEHVLRHGQVREQRRLLVDDRDAGRPRRRRAVQRDLLARRPTSAPASGWYTPARILTSVDLPAPFSPTRACTSPGYSSIDPSSSACTAPNDFAA